MTSTEPAPRFRFQTDIEIAPGYRLHLLDQVIVLHDKDGAKIELRPKAQGETIYSSAKLLVAGGPFHTEQEARETGIQTCNTLKLAAARSQLGVVFGPRPRLERGLSALVTAGPNSWIQVFRDDRRGPRGGATATVTLGRPGPRFLRSVEASTTRKLRMTDLVDTAYEVYAASTFISYPDARFLLLMTAVETLIVQDDRDATVVRHLQDLIDATTSSNLPRSEIQSLMSSLESLKRESVGRGGRRLAKSLGQRTYESLSPVNFFNKCYDLRSQLVHGHYPRPSLEAVGKTAEDLDRFVANLLSGDLLDLVVD